MSVAGQSIPGSADDPLNEGTGVRMMFDLQRIDLSKRMYSREDIARYNPHRGNMALIDSIVWETPDHKQGVAIKHVRHDESGRALGSELRLQHRHHPRSVGLDVRDHIRRADDLRLRKRCE